MNSNGWRCSFDLLMSDGLVYLGFSVYIVRWLFVFAAAGHQDDTSNNEDNDSAANGGDDANRQLILIGLW
jgi:hypothetical protein